MVHWRPYSRRPRNSRRAGHLTRYLRLPQQIRVGRLSHPTRPLQIRQCLQSPHPAIPELFDMQSDPATANYDLPVLTPFRATRFQQSISQNPYFFNGPFSGVSVQPAAYTFIYRFMSNKSTEYPKGVLNQDVLKSFFSIAGESSNFTWTEGHEKIPDNWYKRAIGDEYTISFSISDVIAAALEYPQFLDIGWNTGKPNTFTGVDLDKLTGGVFDVGTLLQGNNLQCFVFQVLQQGNPDVLGGLVTDVSGALSTLGNAINGIVSGLGCPKLENYDESQFDQYPGAKGIGYSGTHNSPA